METVDKKPDTKIIIKGSVLLNLILGVAVGFLALMLAQESGCCAPPNQPDTTGLIVSEEPYGPPVLPELPKDAGVARPTADTVWVTDTFRYPLPEWRIGAVDYRNGALQVVAAKPVRRKDSTEIYSATWYAPGGFQIRVLRDSIWVDTFAHPPPVVEQHNKIWHWVVEAGFDYVAADSTVRFVTRPMVTVGGELGCLRLGRALWYLTPAQFMWIGGGSGSSGVLAVGCKVAVRF